MRNAKTFLAVAAAGLLALWGGQALAANDTSTAPEASKAPEAFKSTTRAASKTVVRRVRGEVTAVEPNAKTMTVKVMEGKKENTIGVDVPDKARIREGKAHKTLADLKVGDRVWMKYERTADKLVAEDIHILKPVHMAAKK